MDYGQVDDWPQYTAPENLFVMKVTHENHIAESAFVTVCTNQTLLMRRSLFSMTPPEPAKRVSTSTIFFTQLPHVPKTQIFVNICMVKKKNNADETDIISVS